MTGQPQTSDRLSPEAQALAGRLRDAGLNPAAAAKTAATLLAVPDRGPTDWVGPVDLAAGIVLWVTLPGEAT